MKKVLKFMRGLLVFVGWTFVSVSFFNMLISLIWNFDFMSAHSWHLLSKFWNSGGVIKTTSDVLLITLLFLLPVLWFIGFILVLKINYLRIFLLPITLSEKIFHRKKDDEPKRIVLKNIKSSQQMVEEIKSKIESLKPEKAKEAGNIRTQITQKLSEEIKK